MKILMVTNTYVYALGGLEKSVQAFTRIFREQGHEVLIAGPDFVGRDFQEKRPEWRRRRKNVLTRFFKKGVASLTLPFRYRLERKVARFKPDIIHAHHPFLMGEMGLRFSAYYAKPVVFTYHILFSHYAHYLPLLPSGFSGRFLSELAAGFCNLTHRVIAPSESIREILQEQGVRTPIDVVPTGIETARFSAGRREKKRLELEIPGHAVLFGYAGRFAEEKNLGFLTRSLAQLMQENPEAYFVMAGKGPETGALAKPFDEAGVRSRLRFAGNLTGQDLVDCYHAMDAFVFASESETQGLVLGEAMAAGIPVIAADAPGVREIVKDFVNGRLSTAGDTAAFKEAVSWFMKQPPGVIALMKQKARETAADFSLDICARRLLKTYRAAQEEYKLLSIKKPCMASRAWRCVDAETKIFVNLLKALFAAFRPQTRPALKQQGPGDFWLSGSGQKDFAALISG